MQKFFLHLILLFIASRPAFSDENSLTSVFSKSGNIYYINDKKQSIQITHSGKDSSPVLSTNKKMIAFVRVGNLVIPNSCDIDATYGGEVWMYDFFSKKEKLLVKSNFECDKPKKQIVDPSNLVFSPDDKVLYFITTAWTTSGAAHSVNINTKEQNFIVDANDIKVISKGSYKGYLLVYRHRYFIGGGTYDWYWMVSPYGKEEGPLGPEISKDQMNIIETSL